MPGQTPPAAVPHPHVHAIARRRGRLVAVAIWSAALLGVWGSLLWYRHWVLDNLGSDEAVAQWQRWKAKEIERDADPNAPVRRRIPKADAPPMFILMRDSFPGIVVATLICVSAVYSLGYLIVRGILAGREHGALSKEFAPPGPPMQR